MKAIYMKTIVRRAIVVTAIGSPLRFLLVSGLFLSMATGAQGESPVIPSIDPEAITVSGVSAGGVMAQQLHIAYADRIRGAGIIAGVPWGCAEGQLGLALGRCMGKSDEALPVATLLEDLRGAAERGEVAGLAALADDRAWLFHGTLDAAVGGAATDATVALYEALLPTEQITYVNDVDAAHHFPTLDAGVACTESSPPWLGACDYDAAGEMLSFLYQDLTAPGQAQRSVVAEGELVELAVPGAAAAGMAERAWVFIPESCPPEGCRLHVALHGCAMAESQNGMAFMEDSGYLPWARANQLVIAFPQVAAQPLNPLGCWDWWGYTGPNYLQRDGAQLKVIADWVSELSAPR